MNEEALRATLGPEWDVPHLSLTDCIDRLVGAESAAQSRLRNLHKTLNLRVCAQCMNLHPQNAVFCPVCDYDRTAEEDDD